MVIQALLTQAWHESCMTKPETMRRLNMAKKILAVSLVLGLALAGMAFAGGPTTHQRIVVTGTVSIDNLFHAVLRTGDRAYELIVPQDLVYQSGVAQGSRLTVEGYAAQGGPTGMPSQFANNVIALVVTRATIDGRNYDLAQYRGGQMGNEPRADGTSSTVRGHRWDNGRDNGRGNRRGWGRDNGRDNGRGYGNYNGRDNGRDNGRGNGQGNGRDNGRGNGQGNGRDNGRDNGQDNVQGT